MIQPALVTTLDYVRAHGLAALDVATRRLRSSLNHTVEVVWRFVQLVTILGLRVLQGFRARRAYRLENQRRHITRHGHRYLRGKTPLAFSWESVRLCIMTERLDPRRSRFPRGYTLVDVV